MLISSSIAFSYFFSIQRRTGIFLIGLAWLVAWSRVYLGVHFPLDMLGGFFLAFSLNLLGLSVWNRYKNSLLHYVLYIYEYLFRKLIEKGFVR